MGDLRGGDPPAIGEYTWSLNAERDTHRALFYNETPMGQMLKANGDYTVSVAVATNPYIERSIPRPSALRERVAPVSGLAGAQARYLSPQRPQGPAPTRRPGPRPCPWPCPRPCPSPCPRPCPWPRPRPCPWPCPPPRPAPTRRPHATWARSPCPVSAGARATCPVPSRLGVSPRFAPYRAHGTAETTGATSCPPPVVLLEVRPNDEDQQQHRVSMDYILTDDEARCSTRASRRTA